MSETVDAFPLTWPAHWPRAPRRERSRFDVTFGQARDGVLDELHRLGARGVVISTNAPLRRDGLPYANKIEPDDPAVAVYFTLNGEQKCIPCDKWDRCRDNLRAIQLTIAALRGLDRWGAKETISAAFAGFAALPDGATSGPSWWSVLGVSPDASEMEIEKAYRSLVKQHHPDVGGDADMFRAVNLAYRATKAAS